MKVEKGWQLRWLKGPVILLLLGAFPGKRHTDHVLWVDTQIAF